MKAERLKTNTACVVKIVIKRWSRGRRSRGWGGHRHEKSVLSQWLPLPLFGCAGQGRGGARVRGSGVTRGRWRREEGQGLAGPCPWRRRQVAVSGCPLPLFGCGGWGRVGQGLGLRREQREMEKWGGHGGQAYITKKNCPILWRIVTDPSQILTIF